MTDPPKPDPDTYDALMRSSEERKKYRGTVSKVMSGFAGEPIEAGEPVYFCRVDSQGRPIFKPYCDPHNKGEV